MQEVIMENIQVTVEKGKPEAAKTGALLVGMFEKVKKTPVELSGLDKTVSGAVSRLISSGDFAGKMAQCVWLFPSEAPFKRLLVVGLGPREKFIAETFRRVIGHAAREVRRLKISDVAINLPESSDEKFPGQCDLARAAVEGFTLGAYQFRKYKSKNDDKNVIKKITVRTTGSAKEISAARSGADLGSIVAESVTLARDLANTPGNDLPPEALARVAKEQAKKWGLKCKVLGVSELKKLKMNGILAVGGGSSRPPCLAIIEYAPKGADAKKPPLVFVGKGITFDSGGISIKPAANMEQMKDDMSGAAAVLGVAIIAARRKWKRRLVCLMPMAENMPGSKAYRPGDVVITSSGVTVEVISTDAEGRMILSDALHYAGRFKPAAVIDVATLTGACVIALGHEAIGLMGKDQELIQRILNSGADAGEHAWQLPLWEEHDEYIKSDIADIKNAGGRAAGTITGAAFLARFAKDYKWAHLDIAGTAWSDREMSYKSKGATGAGVRILAEFGENFE